MTFFESEYTKETYLGTEYVKANYTYPDGTFAGTMHREKDQSAWITTFYKPSQPPKRTQIPIAQFSLYNHGDILIPIAQSQEYYSQWFNNTLFSSLTPELIRACKDAIVWYQNQDRAHPIKMGQEFTNAIKFFSKPKRLPIECNWEITKKQPSTISKNFAEFIAGLVNREINQRDLTTISTDQLIDAACNTWSGRKLVALNYNPESIEFEETNNKLSIKVRFHPSNQIL